MPYVVYDNADAADDENMYERAYKFATQNEAVDFAKAQASKYPPAVFSVAEVILDISCTVSAPLIKQVR